jgi:3-hydroxybutyryl-CoA dehydrogenase
MTILVIGEDSTMAECGNKFGDRHQLLHVRSHHDARPLFARASLILDFIIDDDPSQLQFYTGCKVPVFLNSVKTTLQQLIAGAGLEEVKFFGFNGLPTFVNRPVLELAIAREADREDVASICAGLDTGFEIVDDRPGMVSARVICMIVNEAYCSVEDGTALPSDIDVAMRLGTNYPRGPVEWGRAIGLRNVCDVLGALYRETQNERYRTCDLLSEEARQE